MIAESGTMVVTQPDRARLEQMLRSLKTAGAPFRDHIRELELAVGRAEVVPAADVGPDVITMNSRARVRDVDSGRNETFTLVYHGESGMFDSKLSVLTSLGIATLGARVGDVIEWRTPRTTRRLRVEEVVYQPEAAGDTNL